MSGHFIETCTKCGTVISQCRCPALHKEQRHGICDKCKGSVSATSPLKVLPHTPKPRDGWDVPSDAIVEFAEEVKAGKHKPKHVLILFFEEDEDTKRLKPRRWYANCSTTEAVALLTAATHQEIADWKE